MPSPDIVNGSQAQDTSSALRYWEDVGLLPAPKRISGQRRYPESAVALVGLILLLRDAGFMAARGVAPDEWRRLNQRKLAELDEQIAKAQAAREAIDHGLRCRHQDILRCPNVARGITARLAGQSLQEAHSEAHSP